MKNIFRITAIFCAFLILIFRPINSAASETDEVGSAEILVEAKSGKVLYEKNSSQRYQPGSLCKAMTILLTAEAIDKGALSLDTVLTASERANSAGGAVIWLNVGEKITVDELLRGVIIGNANDAAIALAEGIAGTEEKFVRLMNERIKELGGENTIFTSCCTDGDGQYTTVYDMALIGCELLKYDFLKDTFNRRLDYVRGGQTELVNQNKLISGYDGIFGIKAGYSEQSGYSLMSAAKRETGEYVAVILGGDKDGRFSRARELLDNGFSLYRSDTPLPPDELMFPIEVTGGREREIYAKMEKSERLVFKKGSKVTYELYLPDTIPAPIAKGQIIGMVYYKIGDEVIFESEIVAEKEVPKLKISDTFAILVGEMLKF